MRAGVVSFAWAPAYSVPLAPLKAGSTVTLAKKDNDGKNWNKHGKHNWNDNGKNYKWSGKRHGGKNGASTTIGSFPPPCTTERSPAIMRP